MNHGLSGYRHHRCRCEDCTRANTEACARYRNKRPPRRTDLVLPDRDGYSQDRVDRACSGDPVPLTVPERRAVTARLRRQPEPVPYRDIADLLGLSIRVVQRYASEANGGSRRV